MPIKTYKPSELGDFFVVPEYETEEEKEEEYTPYIPPERPTLAEPPRIAPIDLSGTDLNVYDPSEVYEEFIVKPTPEYIRTEKRIMEEEEKKEEDIGWLARIGRAIGRRAGQVERGILGIARAHETLPQTVSLSILKRTDPAAYDYIQQNRDAYERAAQEKAESWLGPLADFVTKDPEFVQHLEDKINYSLERERDKFAKSREAEKGIYEGAKSFTWWAENSMDVAGQLATMVGMNAILPGSGMPEFIMEVGGNTYIDVKNRLKDKDGWTEDEREVAALGSAAIQSAAEAVTGRIPFKLLTDRKFGKDFVFRKIAERWLGKAGAIAVGVPASESFEEVVAGVSGDVNKWLLEGDPDAFKGAAERYLTDLALGFVGGTMVGAPAAGIKTVEGRKRERFKSDVKKAADWFNERIKTEDGRSAIEKLISIEDPSRSDFEKAGIRGIRLSNEFRRGIKDLMSEDYDAWRNSDEGKIALTEFATPESQSVVSPALRNSKLTQEQKQLVTTTAEGEVNPVVNQIPEAVEEIMDSEGFRTTGSEREFFDPESGIWTKGIEAARKRKGAFKGADGLNRKSRLAWYASSHEFEKRYDAWVKGGRKGTPPSLRIPFGNSGEFDEVVNPKGIERAVEEFVRDIRPFMEENPEFSEYYSTEIQKELSILSQKYPELQTNPDLFNFYRLLNSIASAQTELSLNTEETDQAYGGFRETGRIPIVFEEVDEGKKKIAPVYGLPRGSEFGAIMPSEIDSVIEGMKQMDAGIPASQAKKIIGTSSTNYAEKLHKQWKEMGEERFRNRARTAFTIHGGSSAYNKAFNYRVINQLLDKFNGNISQLMNWMTERVSVDQLRKDKSNLGFSDEIRNLPDIKDTVWVAEGQDELIPRTFIFGPKVGAYTLNRLGDGRYNTMDVWESRAWRSYFTGLNDKSMGIAEGVPRRVYMRAAILFPEIWRRETGRDIGVSSGQAARWYYTMQAMKKAGYIKISDKETIARYTEAVMDRWASQQLGKALIDIDAISEYIIKTPEEEFVPPTVATEERERGRYVEGIERPISREGVEVGEAITEREKPAEVIAERPARIEEEKPKPGVIRPTEAIEPEIPPEAKAKEIRTEEVPVTTEIGQYIFPSAKAHGVEKVEKPVAKPISAREAVLNSLRRIGIHQIPSIERKKLKAGALAYYEFIVPFRKDVSKGGRKIATHAHNAALIGTMMHEIAHALDDIHNITGYKELMPGIPEEIRPPALSTAPSNSIDEIKQLDYEVAYGNRSPADGRIVEGYAELVRIYVTHEDPSTVAPNAVDWLEKYMIENVEFGKVVRGAREDIQNYRNQTLEQRLDHLFSRDGHRVATPSESYFARLDKRYLGLMGIWRQFSKVVYDMRGDLNYFEDQLHDWFVEHWSNRSNKIYKGWELDPEEAWNAVVAEAGGKPSDLMMFLVDARVQQAEEALEQGVFDPYELEAEHGISPVDIFSDFDESELQRFNQWFFAKVGLEKKAKQEMKGIGYRISEADEEDLIEFISTIESDEATKKKFEKAAEEITNFFDDLLTLQFKHGLLSENAYMSILDSHRYYMPFYRQLENIIRGNISTTVAMGVRSTEMRLKTGGVAPVLDVFEAMVQKARETYAAIANFKIQESTINLAILSGAGSPFVVKVDPKFAVKAFPIRRILRDLVKKGVISKEWAKFIRIAEKIYSGEELTEREKKIVDDYYSFKGRGFDWSNPIGNLKADGVPRVSEFIKLYYPNRRINRKTNIVPLERAGKLEYYRIDPELLNTLRYSSPKFGQLTTIILGKLGRITDFIKGNMVKYNPFYYGPKNLLRDYKTFSIKWLQESDEKDLTATDALLTPSILYAKKFEKEIEDLAKRIKGEYEESDVDRIYRRFGGLTHTKIGRSMTDPQRMKTQSYLRRVIGKSRDISSTKSIKDSARWVGSQIEAFNNVVELLPRRIAFEQTLRKLQDRGGYTLNEDGSISGEVPLWVISQALNNSLETTTNFNRRGSLAYLLEPIFIFYNANIQGTVSQVLTIRKAISSKSHAKRLAYNLALAMASRAAYVATLYFMFGGKDDDEDKERNLWKRYLQIDESRRRANLVIPIPGTNLTLDLPAEREWKAVSWVAEEAAMAALRRGPKDFSEFVQMFAEDFKSEAGGRVPITGGILSTMVQLGFNYNIHWGKPIESIHDEDETPIDRTAPYVSTMANSLSADLGLHKLGLSPKQIDFFIRNTVGGMFYDFGRFTAEGSVVDMPFLGAFANRGEPRQSINDFYTQNQDVTQLINSSESLGITGEELTKLKEQQLINGIAFQAMKDVRKYKQIPREKAAEYITGLAQWALGAEEVDRYPNILIHYKDMDIPIELKKDINNLLKTQAKAAISPRPEKIKKKEGESEEEFERKKKESIEEAKAKARIGRKVIEFVREGK